MKKWIIVMLPLIGSYANALQLPMHTQYLSYQTNSGAASEGFYNHDMHIKWHKEPDVSNMGFYAQFYFTFQAGTGGYTGLQQDRIDGKKAIFSIWDVGNQQTAFPVASNCQRFGHEGTGTSCILPFQWKAGHEYKMRVWRISGNTNGSSEKWGGWAIDYVTGEETLIGIIEVKNSAGYSGYGGLTGSTISTVEFYGANTAATNAVTCGNMPYFGVTWNGPFSNNAFKTPDSVVNKYTTGIGTACPNNVNSVANAPFSATTETGATIRAVVPENTNLWKKYNLQSYREVDCLYNWGEQFMPAAFNQAQFKHRRISRSLFGYYYRDYRSDGDGHALISDTVSNRLFMGKVGGEMEDLGDLTSWKQRSGCRS